MHFFTISLSKDTVLFHIQEYHLHPRPDLHRCPDDPSACCLPNLKQIVDSY